MKESNKIDWSKAPEDATHCWNKMDSFYKFSKHENDFVWQNNEWQKCSDISCFEGELTERPHQSVFTKEMQGAGKLPEVGMKVMIDGNFSDENGQCFSSRVKDTLLGFINGKGIFKDHTTTLDLVVVVDKMYPIDNRTEKEKAIDKIMTEEFIDNGLRDRDLIEAAYDKWVGKE